MATGLTVNLKPLVVVRLWAAVIVASLIIPAVPDVDLWGHTLFGGDIIRAGTIDLADVYSFTSDVEWINHEWLSEICMYAAYSAFGGAGLVGFRLALLTLLFLIVWRTLRKEGVETEAAFSMLIVFALLTYPRTQNVRPQLFSLVAFAALLSTLTAYDRDERVGRLLTIPVLMAVWANLHGGFLVGFLPLSAWAAARIFESRAWVSACLRGGAVLGAAVLATLLNPYGVELWQFLGRTVVPQRTDISEWQSMASAGPGLLSMWLVTAAIAGFGLKWRPRQFPVHRAVVVIALAIASFRVNRLDAFFVTATTVYFGLPLSSFWSRRQHSAPARPMRPVMAMVGLVMAVSMGALLLLRVSPPANGCVDTADWLPGQDASGFVARNKLRGRMVVFFDWGEYVVWHFSPDLVVSTDGRRETVYSNRHIKGHLELYLGTDAGLSYVDGLNPDYVWLPSSMAAVEKLQRRGWVQIYGGERSTILARTPLPGGRASTMEEAACFPGSLGRTSPLSSGLWR